MIICVTNYGITKTILLGKYIRVFTHDTHHEGTSHHITKAKRGAGVLAWP